MSLEAVILIVEDREEDILLMRRAFEKAIITNPLHVVRDGEQAISYLAGSGKYSNRAEYPLPALVLLDLKMPGTDGFEVLKWIREQPTLWRLRVIVLTSSSELRDVNKAYALGANSFMIKPMEFENTVQLSQIMKDYWLSTDRAPEVSRPSRTEKQRS